MRIGLSLSLCIQDIIEGRETEWPDVIVSRAKADTLVKWEYLVEQYCILYWHNNPNRAREIANSLYYEGRIVQPRTLNIDKERWVDI